MKRAISLLWTTAWLAAAAVLGVLFYSSYWRWRGCFDAEGRCFAGDVVHHAQSVYLALPLAVCLIAASIGVVGLFRRPSGRRTVR